MGAGARRSCGDLHQIGSDDTGRGPGLTCWHDGDTLQPQGASLTPPESTATLEPRAPAPPRTGRPGLDAFNQALADSIAQGEFGKLVLASYQGDEAGLQRLVVRRVMLRGEPQLAMVYHFETRDITRNLPVEQGLAWLREALDSHYRHAHLLTTAQELHLRVSKRGQCTLRRGTATQPAAPDASHDREKRRFVDLQRPFLVALGVANARHELIPAMSRKWKQINKFVELFSSALQGSGKAGASQLSVIDFGSGKGYLTFALHDHLVHQLGMQARVTGVELRADMVRLCNLASAQLALAGLSFEQGDVTTHAPQPMDVMVALHACDTATDHAIALGVQAGAQIIMCAPCCHKEVRPQLLSPHPLRAILQHGVHLGQEAEMVTDGLRALLLEACGYATQVFEFVALEHTSKNKMILAVKRNQAATPRGALEQVAEVKRFYGIREQCLEGLLRARFAALDAASAALPTAY